MSPALPPQGLGRGKAKSVGQEAGRACRVEDRALNSGHVVLLCQPHDQHVTLGEWPSGLFSQKLGGPCPSPWPLHLLVCISLVLEIGKKWVFGRSIHDI